MIRRGKSVERSESTDHEATHQPSHVDREHGHEYDEAAAGYAAEGRQRERFGGVNWGASFFGWLVAVGVTVLLASIIGAVAAAVGNSQDITRFQAQSEAGTVGIVAAALLLAVLMIAYYSGGYVAGRMSRFNGGRQGMAVWVIGLVATIAAVVLGIVFGSQYNILERVSLPTMPIPTDTLTLGGVIAAAAVIVGTLFAAAAGGKVGRRYHRRVDDAAFR